MPSRLKPGKHTLRRYSWGLVSTSIHESGGGGAFDRNGSWGANDGSECAGGCCEGRIVGGSGGGYESEDAEDEGLVRDIEGGLGIGVGTGRDVGR